MNIHGQDKIYKNVHDFYKCQHKNRFHLRIQLELEARRYHNLQVKGRIHSIRLNVTFQVTDKEVMDIR